MMHLLLLLLISISSFHYVSAWSGLGHCTVAYIAEALLTDNAVSFVNDLLKNDKGWDICDAATFADKVRKTHEFSYTAPWHFIDANDHPPKACSINFTADCNQGTKPGCVVSAITNMTEQLTNTDSPQRAQALMFLIHFIGDIHQPLHTEGLLRGGNEIFICFYDKCGPEDKPMELHAIWDAEIPNKHRHISDSASWPKMKAAGKLWANDLAASHVPQLWNMDDDCVDITTAQKCALVWAGDSNIQNCKVVLKDYPFKVDKLEDDYFDAAAPVVDTLIAKAGVRLGKWINALAEAQGEGLLMQNGNGEL